MYALNRHQYYALYKTSVRSISVRSGSTYYNSSGTIRNATRIIIHENYDVNNQDGGVALV
jgi:hypothetical protein